MKATLIAFMCTFFEIFDVPVFWPILVMYFIILTCLTMKRQIMVCFENALFSFTYYLRICICGNWQKYLACVYIIYILTVGIIYIVIDRNSMV